MFVFEFCVNESNRKSFNLLSVKAVLGVEHCKHALVKLREEFPQRLLEVDVPVVVVGLQILEEVGEHVRVPLVQNAVSLLEHEVKIPLGPSQQLCEEL